MGLDSDVGARVTTTGMHPPHAADLVASSAVISDDEDEEAAETLPMAAALITEKFLWLFFNATDVPVKIRYFLLLLGRKAFGKVAVGQHRVVRIVARVVQYSRLALAVATY